MAAFRRVHWTSPAVITAIFAYSSSFRINHRDFAPENRFSTVFVLGLLTLATSHDSTKLCKYLPFHSDLDPVAIPAPLSGCSGPVSARRSTCYSHDQIGTFAVHSTWEAFDNRSDFRYQSYRRLLRLSRAAISVLSKYFCVCTYASSSRGTTAKYSQNFTFCLLYLIRSRKSQLGHTTYNSGKGTQAHSQTKTWSLQVSATVMQLHDCKAKMASCTCHAFSGIRKSHDSIIEETNCFGQLRTFEHTVKRFSLV